MNKNIDNRWAIHIDIEGFSVLYSRGSEALWALNKLMLAIHRIGKNLFPESPERLFAHQLGDGFLIVSEFHEDDLDRAASIATVLMKYISSFGVFTRGAIAEGGLSDITGCYSNEVMNDCRDSSCSASKMGSGLLTIFPVMGTALINAVGIDKRSPKGPLLTLPKKYESRLSNSFIVHDIPDTEIISIDWVHTESKSIFNIRDEARLKFPDPANLEHSLLAYMERHKLPDEWKNSCKTHLSTILV